MAIIRHLDKSAKFGILSTDNQEGIIMNCEWLAFHQRLEFDVDFYHKWLTPYINRNRAKHKQRLLQITKRKAYIRELKSRQNRFEMFGDVLAAMSLLALLVFIQSGNSIWIDLACMGVIQGFTLFLLQNKRYRKTFWWI